MDVFSFRKFTAEQVLKSFSGWNNSLESPVFGFSDSLNRNSKMPEISAMNFFCVFLSCHYGYTNYFEILNFLFSKTILGGVPTC